MLCMKNKEGVVMGNLRNVSSNMSKVSFNREILLSISTSFTYVSYSCLLIITNTGSVRDMGTVSERECITRS